MLKILMKLRGVRGTVVAIILKDPESKKPKILLTKRSKKIIIEGGKWCIPGGHIDFGESAENSIKREIKEELNLDVKKVDFQFYSDEIIPKINLHCLNLVFKVEIKDFKKLKLNWESVEFRWFDEEEIEKMNLAFKHKEILRRFFKKR